MPHDMQFDVFLSHSSHDKPVVRALAERLKQDGLRVWFDEWEILPGDPIFAKVEEGLENSRVLIFFMSAHAFGSDWAVLETQTVRFRDPLNRNRRFIPLRLDDAPVKGTLAQFRYLDWRVPGDDIYRSLLAACGKPADVGKSVAAASAVLPPLPSVAAPGPQPVAAIAAHPAQASLTVFISYAWESDDFRTRVRALRDWLRTQGVTVVSDFDHAARPPKAGWPTWMQHSIEDATVVLVVCSPKYKLRFEKRADPASGKGVTWEGAVITQDLYNAAQRNDKVYPIFLDPVNMADVPKALEPWNNGHSFPSKQNGILDLIRECFADAAPAPTLANAQGATGGAPPLPEPAQPTVILPSDSERIAQTRLAILNCLKREHFAGLPNLSFAPDDMPGLLADAFSDKAGSMQRVDVADHCVYAVLKFARAVVVAFAELSTAAPAAALKNKHQCWKRLVNAMQHAILLGAKQNYTANRRIQDAFNGSAPCAVEGMSWLSASMIMRENLADSLRSNPAFPAHAPDAMEDSHADDWSEIEMGTGEPARVQAYKWIKYMLDRGSFPDQPTQRQIEELQGQLKLRKRDGLHLLIFNQKPDCFPPEFIRWLNTSMHVGTITILASNGEFDLPEGDWRACLAELLKVMREFEPPPIRPWNQ